MAAPEPASAPEAVLDGLATAELIDLYFEAEQPAERDALFARLAARTGAEVDAFLSALVAHDNDIFLRLAAAAELATRGYDQARAVLTDTLLAAGDDEVLEEAIDAWVGVAGADAFPALNAIFVDAERDGGERLLAMNGMERADGPRAARAFVEALAEIPQQRAFDPAVLEAMVGTLVRETHAEAPVALRALLARLEATADGEAAFEARREVQAAIAVLANVEAEE